MFLIEDVLLLVYEINLISSFYFSVEFDNTVCTYCAHFNIPHMAAWLQTLIVTIGSSIEWHNMYIRYPLKMQYSPIETLNETTFLCTC